MFTPSEILNVDYKSYCVTDFNKFGHIKASAVWEVTECIHNIDDRIEGFFSFTLVISRFTGL